MDLTQAAQRAQTIFDQEYAALPAFIREVVTKTEFAWMSPDRRARLQDEMTMPEPTEDH